MGKKKREIWSCKVWVICEYVLKMYMKQTREDLLAFVYLCLLNSCYLTCCVFLLLFFCLTSDCNIDKNMMCKLASDT